MLNNSVTTKIKDKGNDASNISIYLNNNAAYPNIEIEIERRKVFETLANKDLIVASLNKKLTEMIQMYLEAQAKKEKEVRENV